MHLKAFMVTLVTLVTLVEVTRVTHLAPVRGEQCHTGNVPRRSQPLQQLQAAWPSNALSKLFSMLVLLLERF